MKQSYITVAGRSCRELTINKSRFIGYAAPCADEDRAQAFLQEVRNQHKTATHHCYAYILGENASVMRYSDNGEPAGTAGLPILDVLKSRQIVFCGVVVVRYFGGVLLGTGGLVRAYTQAAQEAVEAASVSRMELTAVDYCELPYSAWDRFQYSAGRLPVRIEDVSFGSAVGFHLLSRVADHETVVDSLMDCTGRKLEMLPEEETYLPWKM